MSDPWKYVDMSCPDGCWPWTGSRFPKGYGRFGAGLLAHRVIYQLSKGPIPDGMVICHSCDNRPCCNPDHLWVGTYADNTNDARIKGRLSGMSLTHCKAGHEFTPENTYIRPKTGGARTCRKCNAVSQQKRKAKAKEAA